MREEVDFLQKFESEIKDLKIKQFEILNSLKNRDAISFDEVIKKGQELDLLRIKIWTIEDVIHN